MGRRLAALLVDWLIAYGLAALAMTLGWVTLSSLSTAVLLIWFVIGAAAVRLFGFTPGSSRWAGGGGSRRALPCRAGPRRGAWHADRAGGAPLFTDADGRGLQDRVTGTAVVRR
ncbi:putative rDD domain containing protein [Mycobacterium xenopi 4042]|uniref:Putative rDD domain containing protein n=1 Tax=Mycobacterium xenopi 4042 TaxID=1299334 RepID=X8DCC9_MYCXE|nr:putative rDD domain containing protein [Mycobacterium xenopi 4042]